MTIVGVEADVASPLVVNDLGPIQVGGTYLDSIVSSKGQRALFVALALIQDRGNIATDRLVELIWPGDRSTPRRLWDTVYRLRRALASGGVDLGATNAAGRYTFDRPVALDSSLFTKLLAEARAVIDDNPRVARDRLDTALGLWRGDPYDGYDVDALAPGLLSYLHEQRLWAERARVRTMMAIEGPESVVGDLEALACDHPCDEGVAELLVVCLRDVGRRVDGLRRLRRFRTRLADDLGVDWGRRLASLETELLADDLTVDDLVGRTGLSHVRTWRTSFIGRESERRQLLQMVAQHRLVTVVSDPVASARRAWWPRLLVRRSFRPRSSSSI